MGVGTLPDTTEHLQLEIDGPGVSPSTVDSRAALELALAYLSALEKVAGQLGGELQFAGLEVVDKCVAIQVTPSDSQLAKSASHETARLVSGVVHAAPGVVGPIERLRKALRHLPEQQSATVIIGPWKKKLTVGDSVERPWPGARVSMRVFVERVGGAEPSVRVRARGERQPFQIGVTAEQAREFGALLYRQVDIVATLWRDENGQVTEAVLRELHRLDDSPSPKAWFDWLREHGAEWDDAERELEDLAGD